MNQSQRRIATCAIAVVVVLFILVLIVRYALREAPTSTQQEPPRTEPTKSLPRQTTPDFAATDNQPTEAPVSQPEESIVTNAATLYRQAFALYGALSKDEKGILGDWQTNVDSSVEAELCARMRPICDILHKATAVTNCDWGIEPLTFDTKLPHLSPARAVSRAAIWNAAHCRGNNVTTATDDVLSVLRLGKSVSHTAIIGCLVDMAIQGLARSYVTTNLDSLPGAEGQRLSAAFSDATYEAEPSLAMEQEAGMVDHLAVQLVSMPADEFEKNISQMLDGENAPKMDRATALANFQQVADLEHDLARVLASGSADKYEAWLKEATELQEVNPIAKALIPSPRFVERAQSAAVQRSMVVAALAVAQDGPSELQSHLDPSTTVSTSNPASKPMVCR
jgi:hypothetical protein